MRKQRVRVAVLAAAVLGAMGTVAHAQTAYSWGGSNGNNWDVGTNWNPNGVPNGTLGDTGAISSGNAKSDVNGSSVANQSLASSYIGAPGSLNNATITINSGGTLTLGDPGIGNPVVMNGGTIATSDSNHLAGAISVTAASTVTTQFDMPITGAISGTGTITFINNSHNGTVDISSDTSGWTGGFSVQGGGTATETVEFDNGDTNFGTGPVTLIGGLAQVEYDGGTSNVTTSQINGNGNIISKFRNDILVGTIISPGDPTTPHSAGTLGMSYNFVSSNTTKATYVADLNSASSYDVLSYDTFGGDNGATTMNLSNMNLTIDLNYAPSPTDTLFIVQQTGTHSITGTFNGDAQGATIDLGFFGGKDYTAEISYTGGPNSNEVELLDFTAVPEPTSIGLAGIAALGLLGRRRRMHKPVIALS